MENGIFSKLVITSVADVCRVNFRDMGVGTKQNRPMSAIYLKCSGRTTYTDQKGVYVCDSQHLVYLPKGSSYSVSFDVPGECFRIEFDTDVTYDGILSIPISNNATLANEFSRLEKLWLFKKTSYFPKAMSVLYGIFADLDAMITPVYVSNENYRIISGGMKYLETHLDDSSLRIGNLAEASNVSEAYFRRIFGRVYHQSPIDYIRAIRIEKAKSLLSGEYSTIEDVAYAVGFSSLAHFSKTFRQIMGQSPSDYAREKE